jgi:hypothetical protein
MVFTLAGRIKAEHITELKALLESELSGIVLDLKAVKLVDLDAVRFLTQCETGGARLENCPPYIREWISREKNAT